VIVGVGHRVTVGVIDRVIGKVVGIGVNDLVKETVSDVERVRVRVPEGDTVGVGNRLAGIVGPTERLNVNETVNEVDRVRVTEIVGDTVGVGNRLAGTVGPTERVRVSDDVGHRVTVGDPDRVAIKEEGTGDTVLDSEPVSEVVRVRVTEVVLETVFA
jgi:hypothetical protein